MRNLLGVAFVLPEWFERKEEEQNVVIYQKSHYRCRRLVSISKDTNVVTVSRRCRMTSVHGLHCKDLLKGDSFTLEYGVGVTLYFARKGGERMIALGVNPYT